MALVEPRGRNTPSPRRFDGDEPLALGVASGLARLLDLDPVAVRMFFVVATVAGGWGALLYGVGFVAVVWRRDPPIRSEPSRAQTAGHVLGSLLLGLGMLLVLRSRVSGFHDPLVWPTAVVGAMVVLGWRRFDLDPKMSAALGIDDGSGWTLRSLAQAHLVRCAAGVLLVLGGFAYLGAADLPIGTLRDGLVAIGVVMAGVLLVFAPWVLQLTNSLADERRERIRADERAEVAMHLHDSVLQTLTLLQKRSDDPHVMAALARHQERELRRWLYGSTPAPNNGLGFRQAVEAMVAEVEDQHLVHVDNVTVGDGPVELTTQAMLSAAREALVNAAKFSGERTVSLYAELRPQHVELYVRDRGNGFCLDDVAPDRKGISDSIVARLARLGGTADVRTAPGAGTEVRLRLELPA